MSKEVDNRGTSLYDLSTTAVIKNFSKLRHGLNMCPENIHFDVIYSIYKRNSSSPGINRHNKRIRKKGLDLLTTELCHFPTFAKLLRIGDKRSCLHKMLQASLEHERAVPDMLAQAFYQDTENLLSKLTSPTHNNLTVSNTCKSLDLGFNLGGFLGEGGWYPAASSVHRACVNILRRLNQKETGYLFVKLECLTKLLHSLSNYCLFSEAGNIYTELTSFIWDNNINQEVYPNLAYIYSEISSYFFMKSDYGKAFSWALESIKILSPKLPTKLTIDVLRQASKSCVVKREFAKAEILIKQAVSLSKRVYGDIHNKYADTLIDYGFYLLNVDCIKASMQVYKNALEVRKASFGGENLHVALAHEDLAYATYVHEYSSGKFGDARRHAEKSMEIMMKHLPKDHLFLASSKRVLALILEEIAIDSQGNAVENTLLIKSEDLHLFALNLAKLNFGECNVQTAKHYGNLGRLYQTMERFHEAEKMHLKAIQIKENLLGPDDYEVALSVGHLASLYNYDMKEYLKAEQLYLRSITIGRKLFGPTYSGLEYDYRGLIQVYQVTHEMSKFVEYTNILEEWKISRDARAAEQAAEVSSDQATKISLADLIKTVTHTVNSSGGSSRNSGSSNSSSSSSKSSK